ncbi:facilitated trehalose transporter Tret1-like isoform X2 [Daktulosphaira vitifoliae]|nr:facilitated trehalose transporter Tret1-like isoform X2 [Daktulosphaira vitifoliae]XP_050520687.1 facilitated trehalose transporter Tret1-like isoform X2 [Daktulosphaira vitifoliae]XP_050520688.1 facilitated trehalose transporter Tret1-like isoform X2 [Daktulosphaira vitifoliae]
MVDIALMKQIFATVTASISIFIAGSWLGWPSATADKLLYHKTDFNVSVNEFSWIVSIMDVGNIISPIPAGYMMDFFGRKKTVSLLGPLYIISWILPSYVGNIWSLYIARFLGGLGKGISYTVVPVFLGEIAGVKIRGALSSVFAIHLAGGFLFEAIIGPYVSFKSLNLITAIIPTLFLIMFIWVPESPYYLLKKGRRDEAAKCLRWYRNGNDSELQEMEENVQNDMKNKGNYWELFKNPKNLKAIVIISTASFAQRAGGISSLMAYSTLALPEPVPIGRKSDYIILFAVLKTGVNFFGLALVDRIGRKPLLLFSEISLGLVTFVDGLFFFLQNYINMTPYNWIPYVCLELFPSIYALGIGFIPVVFLGEMLPVNVRAHGSAFMSIVLAFSSFISNAIFLIISYKCGFYVMLWLFSIVNFICAYFAYKMAIETNGKTFSEIQNLLEESLKNNKKKSIYIIWTLVWRTRDCIETLRRLL